MPCGACNIILHASASPYAVPTLCGSQSGMRPRAAMVSMYGRPCIRPATVSMFIAVVTTVTL